MKTLPKLWLTKSIGFVFATLITSLVVLGLAATSVFAGGPADRPTFTSKNPADYVVFNAITDNPEHGDERNFVLIREAGVGTYVNEIKLQPGKEYEVYSYYHNNAKSSLNTGAGTGIAKNVRMSADVPTVLQQGEKGKISTSITADNANPQKVWDEAYITTDSTVALRYVPGSAIIHSGGAVNGKILSDSLFSTNGTFLGYSQLNGILPGCADYSGYVIYRLKVDQPNFEVTKQVSPSGQNKWSKSVASSLSSKVDFKITYKNTGTTTQNDVTIKDVLPKGLTYVNGSTVLVNNSNPNGLKVSDGVIANGINIGNYGAGASASVTFSATVIGDRTQLVCGPNTLTNTVSVITSNGTKKDDASVVVTVECKPDECKPGVPKGDKRCEACVPKQGETVDKNGNCVPAALPTTGPAQIIAGILGVALVALGVAYWIRSRNSYKKALAGFTEDFSEEPKEELLTARTTTHEDKNHARNLHK